MSLECLCIMISYQDYFTVFGEMWIFLPKK